MVHLLINHVAVVVEVLDDFSIDHVEGIFSEGRLDPLSGEWASHRNAAVLTLGTILSQAVRRRLKAMAAPPKTTTEEYREVLKLSKEFDERLASLRDRDDAPPRLPVGRSGRTWWESLDL